MGKLVEKPDPFIEKASEPNDPATARWAKLSTEQQIDELNSVAEKLERDGDHDMARSVRATVDFMSNADPKAAWDRPL